MDELPKASKVGDATQIQLPRDAVKQMLISARMFKHVYDRACNPTEAAKLIREHCTLDEQHSLAMAILICGWIITGAVPEFEEPGAHDG